MLRSCRVVLDNEINAVDLVDGPVCRMDDFQFAILKSVKLAPPDTGSVAFLNEGSIQSIAAKKWGSQLHPCFSLACC